MNDAKEKTFSIKQRREKMGKIETRTKMLGNETMTNQLS